jgi:hypothetical protein
MRNASKPEKHEILADVYCEIFSEWIAVIETDDSPNRRDRQYEELFVRSRAGFQFLIFHRHPHVVLFLMILVLSMAIISYLLFNIAFYIS